MFIVADLASLTVFKAIDISSLIPVKRQNKKLVILLKLKNRNFLVFDLNDFQAKRTTS